MATVDLFTISHEIVLNGTFLLGCIYSVASVNLWREVRGSKSSADTFNE